MSEIPLFPHSHDLPPKERVARAGIFLLRHLNKVPTQDQVVQALACPGGTSTGKATVNKYWPSFQKEIAKEVSLAEWLPEELPEFVVEYLRNLMDWARKDADAQLRDAVQALDERERRLNEEEEERRQTEERLRDEISNLKKTLAERDVTAGELKAEIEERQLALSTAQRTIEVQNVNLSHLAERLEDSNAKLEELKENQRLREAEHVKRLESLQGKLDQAQLKANQETEALVTMRNSFAELERTSALQAERLDRASQREAELLQSLNHAKEKLNHKDTRLQSCEVELAEQKGRLALLDSLQSSLTTTTSALNQAKDRIHELEVEKASHAEAEDQENNREGPTG